MAASTAQPPVAMQHSITSLSPLPVVSCLCLFFVFDFISSRVTFSAELSMTWGGNEVHHLFCFSFY